MLHNPKRNSEESLYEQNDWYKFYAGYSDHFVNECIDKYVLEKSHITILDPWNGTGTTTICAGIKGIKSVGYDINPAMYVIAKAKLYSKDITQKEEWIKLTDPTEKIPARIRYNDPLCRWFSRETVRSIRSLEQNVINRLLYGKVFKYCKDELEDLDNRSAYIYLCFFLLLKEFTSSLRGSNPTWIKSSIEKPIVLSYEELQTGLLEIINSHNSTSKVVTLPSIKVSPSQSIPLKDNSIDLIISSPPYCTRIDYAIYTQLENAMLGYSREDVETLRAKMIGSPTIHHNSQLHFELLMEKLPYCHETLSKIYNHDSKAAQSYYYKTYKQYFAEMTASIAELSRVLMPGGSAVLVVQDSWFKDVHIDVSRAIMEIGNIYQMDSEREDYKVKNNMVYINTKSRMHTNKKTSTESVIIFRKVNDNADR